MADLVLKDRDGTQITYNGVEVVSIPNAEGGTSHFLNLETGGIPSGGTDGQVLKKLSETDYDAGWEDEVDITGKADKVTSPTLDNFASLDANGNLKDSGKKASDFETADTAIMKTDEAQIMTADLTLKGVPTTDNMAASKKYVDDGFEPKDITILKKANVVNDLVTGGMDVPLSAEVGKLIGQDVEILKTDNTTNKTDITLLQKEVKDTSRMIAEANPNGEPYLSTEGYGTLGTPKNATGGLGVELRGNTLRNLVVNGDFSDGTTGWVWAGSTIAVTTGKTILTSDGTSSYGRLTRYGLGKLEISQKIYCRAYVKVTNTACNNINMFIRNHTSVLLQEVIKLNTPLQNITYLISGIVETSAAYDLGLSLSINQNYADVTTANGKVMEIQNVMAVNLTAHGLDTLTVAQCDLMTDMYFEGTQSAMVSRVVNIGKNLSPINVSAPAESNALSMLFSIRNGKRFSSNNFNIYYDDAVSADDFISVQPNTSYTLSAVSPLEFRLALVAVSSRDDTAGRYINGGTNAGSRNFTFTTGATENYVILTQDSGNSVGLLGNVLSDIQLELGAEVTTYEPYRKQEQYIKPYALNRLPNGTCDTIVNGKYTGRVKKYVLTEGDIVSVATIGTNVNYARINHQTLEGAKSFSNNVVGQITVGDLQEVTVSNYDNTNNIGKFFVYNVGEYHLFGIVISKDTTLTQAKTAFAGTVIYYELNPLNYVIDNNIATGLLNANPNGTVYFDNGFADAGIYNDGITILNTDYPIEILETLIKLNADGSYTELNVSTATIALNKLSFTHTGITNGDIVAFTYKGADSLIKGSNKLTYLDSKNVIADTANGKFYKYKPVVTNGVIASWAVVEV